MTAWVNLDSASEGLLDGQNGGIGFEIVGGIGAGNNQHWWAIQPARPDLGTISVRRAYVELLVVYGVFFGSSIAVAAFSLAQPVVTGAQTWQQAIPFAIDQVATTVLCVLVPVLLVRRRGGGLVDLGITRPTATSMSSWIRMAAWAVLAILCGNAVTGAFSTSEVFFGPLTAPNLTAILFHAAQAGFIEEVVVLAFVVSTLELARRPLPEIVVVALVLRATYHIYYGPGVLGIFIWASVFIWLFLRYRTIIPLIVVHSLWDVGVLLGDKWHSFRGVVGLLCLGLFVTAIALWLAERGERKRGLYGRTGDPTAWG